MNKAAYLHLTLHLVNGSRQQFVQSDPDRAQAILDQMRPERVFTPKQLLIAGAEAVTVIPTESVERIDLRSDPLPDWQHLAPNVASVSEITEDAYLRVQHREPPPPPPPVLGRAVPPPPPPQIGVAVELRSGAVAYVSVRTKRPTPEESSGGGGGGGPVDRPTAEDTRMFLQHLFDRAVLFGRMDEDQGIFLLNPAMAVRCTLTPPPPLLPGAGAGTWPMSLVEHT